MESESESNVKIWEISGNDAIPRYAKRILDLIEESQELCSLEVMKKVNSVENFSEETMELVCEALKSSKFIQSISFYNINFALNNNRFIFLLEKAFREAQAQLVNIKFFHVNISVGMFKILIDSIASNQTLKIEEFEFNENHDHSFDVLNPLSQFDSLVLIDVSGCDLSKITYASQPPALQLLSVETCSLEDAQIGFIAEMLEKHNTIVDLDVSGNEFTNDGMQLLCSKLALNLKIKNFKYGYNFQVTDDTLILEVFDTNNTLEEGGFGNESGSGSVVSEKFLRNARNNQIKNMTMQTQIWIMLFYNKVQNPEKIPLWLQLQYQDWRKNPDNMKFIDFGLFDNYEPGAKRTSSSSLF